MLKRPLLAGLSVLFLTNGAAVFARGMGGGHLGGGPMMGRAPGFDRGFGRPDWGDRGLGDYGMRGSGDYGYRPDVGRALDDYGFGGVRNYGAGDLGLRAGSGFDRISGLHNSAFDGHHLYNHPAGWNDNRADLIRNNFYGHPFLGRDWWDRHPWGWYYPGWGWGGGAAWLPYDWDELAPLLGMDAAVVPTEYDYGTNVTYNDDEVYYGSEPYASADQYYQQAQTLATSTTASSKPTKAEVWKPLGVFSLVQGQQTDSTTLLQLAINPKGEIAGNYYDMLSDTGQQIHGKLNKKSQRLAFTVGDNKNVVYDAGLGNLLAKQAPMLVHFGKDRTEQFLLVRLDKPKSDEIPASNSQPKKS